MFVRDPHYRLLGWADSRGTYDQLGRKVLEHPAPEFELTLSFNDLHRNTFETTTVTCSEWWCTRRRCGS